MPWLSSACCTARATSPRSPSTEDSPNEAPEGQRGRTTLLVNTQPIAGGAEGLTGLIGPVCQSGATAFGPFLVRAVENGIGFSYIISTGNEADLDFTDFARYLLDDPDTRVIAGFVEGFKRADKFLEVAKLAAERRKPIVLIKIGRSELGARAARSHTAALT